MYADPLQRVRARRTRLEPADQFGYPLDGAIMDLLVGDEAPVGIGDGDPDAVPTDERLAVAHRPDRPAHLLNTTRGEDGPRLARAVVPVLGQPVHHRLPLRIADQVVAREMHVHAAGPHVGLELPALAVVHRPAVKDADPHLDRVAVADREDKHRCSRPADLHLPGRILGTGPRPREQLCAGHGQLHRVRGSREGLRHARSEAHRCSPDPTTPAWRGSPYPATSGITLSVAQELSPDQPAFSASCTAGSAGESTAGGRSRSTSKAALPQAK